MGPIISFIHCKNVIFCLLQMQHHQIIPQEKTGNKWGHNIHYGISPDN